MALHVLFRSPPFEIIRKFAYDPPKNGCLMGKNAEVGLEKVLDCLENIKKSLNKGISIQTIIICTVGLFVLLMFLFPPFHLVANGRVINTGYSFILSPPGYSTINVGVLFIQIVVICILGAIAYLLTKDLKTKFFKSYSSDQSMTEVSQFFFLAKLQTGSFRYRGISTEDI